MDPKVKKLEKLRKKHGYKQKEIIRILGTTKQTYINWKKGKHSPYTNSKRKIEQVINFLQAEEQIMSKLTEFAKEQWRKMELIEELSMYTNTDRDDLEEMDIKQLKTMKKMSNLETEEDVQEKKERLDKWLEARERYANGEIETFAEYKQKTE